jgi:hypothetical protein
MQDTEKGNPKSGSENKLREENIIPATRRPIDGKQIFLLLSPMSSNLRAYKYPCMSCCNLNQDLHVVENLLFLGSQILQNEAMTTMSQAFFL